MIPCFWSIEHASLLLNKNKEHYTYVSLYKRNTESFGIHIFGAYLTINQTSLHNKHLSKKWYSKFKFDFFIHTANGFEQWAWLSVRFQMKYWKNKCIFWVVGYIGHIQKANKSNEISIIDIWMVRIIIEISTIAKYQYRYSTCGHCARPIWRRFEFCRRKLNLLSESGLQQSFMKYPSPKKYGNDFHKKSIFIGNSNGVGKTMTINHQIKTMKT